ncbi:MAG: DUF1559 domain-containing protein [Planctomycetes bacterium]|nr:DUF1559 domain-containing protein [Planctomycetota bacterium]
MVPALTKAKEGANRAKCANNLRQIGLAGIQYADNTRAYPYANGDMNATLAILRKEGYLDLDGAALGCPSNPGGASYDGFKAPYPNSTRSSTLIAWDLTPHSGRKGEVVRNVMFADCTVQTVNAAEFERLLAEHDALVEKILAKQPR